MVFKRWTISPTDAELGRRRRLRTSSKPCFACFFNFIERRILRTVLSTPMTHQGGLADLEAAAAAADPFSLSLVFCVEAINKW